jgi:hypothetical protein
LSLSDARWKVCSPSPFPWEEDALSFIRNGLPDHDPYRVWANFEFLAQDGSINEVDLLVTSPAGFFLIEIKSWPGRVTGDAGTWTVDEGQSRKTFDNPVAPSYFVPSAASKL